MNNLDVMLFRFLNGLAERSLLLDGSARFLTLAGWAGAVWILIALTVVGVGRHLPAWRLTGLVMIGLVILTGILDSLIKIAFKRPRPPITLPETRLLLPLPGSYSFLSGHTLSSFAAATFLALALHRLGGPSWAGPALLLLAALIGWSRIHVGHHYPVDVFAGWLTGMALGWLTWTLLLPLLD